MLKMRIMLKSNALTLNNFDILMMIRIKGPAKRQTKRQHFSA